MKKTLAYQDYGSKDCAFVVVHLCVCSLKKKTFDTVSPHSVWYLYMRAVFQNLIFFMLLLLFEIRYVLSLKL